MEDERNIHFQYLIKEISKPGIKALIIGEDHFSTGDTADILRILEVLQDSYHLTFFVEYMPSNQPDGFNAEEHELNKFVTREDKGEFDLLGKNLPDRSCLDNMTREFEGWMRVVEPQAINLELALSSTDKLASMMCMNIKENEELGFEIKAKKVISVLNFASKCKVPVFGIDLPGAPESPAPGFIALQWELFYQWDNARDVWMARQIDDFLLYSKPNDFLVCFVGAAHITGLKAGNRNDAVLRSSNGETKFTGLRNPSALFLELVGVNQFFKIQEAGSNHLKYWAPK